MNDKPRKTEQNLWFRTERDPQVNTAMGRRGSRGTVGTGRPVWTGCRGWEAVQLRTHPRKAQVKEETVEAPELARSTAARQTAIVPRAGGRQAAVNLQKDTLCSEVIRKTKPSALPSQG